MRREIRTILIANRGEIALRIIRTCREMGIRSVAVFSDADRFAPYVRAADTALHIGPAQSSESYLNANAILAAAKSAGADAIHPGYGFLSENPRFAEAVEKQGLVFIGPPPLAIETMGDKTRARQLMVSVGVPVVPGTDAPLKSAKDARAFADQHGYPVLLKAAAGGGGKGMRLVRNADELEAAFRGASSEAKAAFGDGRIYVERYLERPRHIEVQILADRHGSVVHLGERECSIQRRHQKVIEESPSPVLDEASRTLMTQTAVRAAKACGYVNAGTIEFLRDADGKFYFLEMNTRLQVEHPVTELRTGLDLVSLQIQIAAGAKLPFSQQEVTWRGHAIECRICAEDAENDFFPSTGTLVHLRPASGPGIREDRGVEQGGEISVHYDSMIAKLCAWGSDRAEAIRKITRALQEYEVLGVRTNIGLLEFIVRQPEFISGDLSTHFIDEHVTAPALRDGKADYRRVAALACALLEYEREATESGRGRNGTSAKSAWKTQRFEGFS